MAADKTNTPVSSHHPLFILLLVLAVVLGGGWFAMRNKESVAVVQPIHGPAVQAVYATGTVEATVMLPIAPRVSARLMSLKADEGSEVKKDQVLAHLEDQDLQQRIKELQAQEDYARKQHERYAVLVKQNSISQAAYDRVRSEWKAAKAAVAQVSAELEYMRLIAPADGRIIRRDGEEGQLIPANQPVFWMACCAPLRISAEVDEEDIPLVQPGQEVLIRADAFPGESYHGTVQSITPKGDPIARSYRVRIGFAEDVPLMIGMTAETNIIIRKTDDALLLPSSAVTNGNVWVVGKDNILSEREVTIGASGLQQTEIRDGLQETDRVVLEPDATFVAGMTIHPKLVAQEK